MPLFHLIIYQIFIIFFIIKLDYISQIFTITYPLFLYQISIVSYTADDIRNILRWVKYHKVLGIGYFYLFVDGQAALSENVNLLRMIEGVTVFIPSERLNKYISDSGLRSVMFWLKPFVDKPCNYDLFVK